MGIVSRAVRNISRRKMRALLVIIALGFALSIMISIPAGVLANEKTANTVASSLSNLITQTGATINQTLTQIDCSLAPSFSGFGFTPPSGDICALADMADTEVTAEAARPASFTPGQFGGGTVGGYFGGGAVNGGQANPMNESLYSDINSTLSGVAAVEPILQASEGNNVTRNVDFNGYTRTITIPDTQYTIEGIPLTSVLRQLFRFCRQT